MDIEIYLYVEKCKIIDQRIHTKLRECLSFKKEIGQEGYR